MQYAADCVASSERSLVNLQATRSSATIPDKPDLDIEITASRTELVAARRDYADLRSRYAAAVPEPSLLADIGDLRSYCPHSEIRLAGSESNP